MKDEASKNLARGDRLAAKLRENLKRRKAQSKALAHSAESDSPAEDTLPNSATDR